VFCLIELLFKGDMQNGVLLEWFCKEKLKYQKKYVLCIEINFTVHTEQDLPCNTIMGNLLHSLQCSVLSLNMKHIIDFYRQF
jgi:hypothetical protein